MDNKKIAALFVQEDGCYANHPLIDAWTEARDARLYNGNLPVIAHPPCQLWGAMAAVNYARWGGELAFKGGGTNSTPRIHTPTEFRDLLIAIAKTAKKDA